MQHSMKMLLSCLRPYPTSQSSTVKKSSTMKELNVFVFSMKSSLTLMRFNCVYCQSGFTSWFVRNGHEVELIGDEWMGGE